LPSVLKFICLLPIVTSMKETADSQTGNCYRAASFGGINAS
jgi:hypothetical protein